MLSVARAASLTEDAGAVQCDDLKAKRFYFRTYENSQIRMVDLMKMNLDAKNITKISMKGAENIRSLNP